MSDKGESSSKTRDKGGLDIDDSEHELDDDEEDPLDWDTEDELDRSDDEIGNDEEFEGEDED